MNRIILHIDMNAYFASVAVLLHPEYKNKPLIVGGEGNRGIVSTASYEARKYGIHSAMPTYQAKQLCKNLIICNPDFEVYEKYTYLFVQIIKRYSKVIEMASIDECYVDMTESLKNEEDPLKIIKNIQYSILNELGLPCSIGVAPNKFLAKMASDMKKPLGITVLKKSDIKHKLWPLPINEMYMIGKKTAPKLENIGIKTIGDLANYEDKEKLRTVLGSGTEHMINWANGIDYSPVLVQVDDLKSVGHSRTFGQDTNDTVEMYDMLRKLAYMVSNRAKEQYLWGNSIQLTIKYADFSIVNRTRTIGCNTNEFSMIHDVAVSLFESNYTGEKIRLLGIALQNTVKIDDYHYQMSIFDNFDEPKEEPNVSKIKKIISSINKELGDNVLKTAREAKK